MFVSYPTTRCPLGVTVITGKLHTANKPELNNNMYIGENSPIENIYQNKSRYPEVDLKKILLNGEPDLVLLSSEPYPFKEEHTLEIKQFMNDEKVIFL